MRNRLKLSETKIVQWLIIFFAMTVVVLSLVGDKGLVQLIALKKQQGKLEREIEDLKLERNEWIHKIRSLKNNQTYIETIARGKLGMVRNNETVYQLEFAEE